MPVKVKMEAEGTVLVVHLTGALKKEDYEAFVPAFERLIEERGTLRILMKMEDFRGLKAGALWEDIKFAFKHFSDIDRLAFVGEKKWQKGMSVFCKPFTAARIRYFEPEDEDDALAWLKE